MEVVESFNYRKMYKTKENLMKDVARLKPWPTKKACVEYYKEVSGDERGLYAIQRDIEKHAIIKKERKPGQIIDPRELHHLRNFINNPEYKDLQTACYAFIQSRRVDITVKEAMMLSGKVPGMKETTGLESGFYRKKDLEEKHLYGKYKVGDKVYIDEQGIPGTRSKNLQKGKIIKEYPRFYLVQMKHYKTCLDKRITENA